MRLSRTAIERPVLALVVNLILAVFGGWLALRLPVREYPDVDPPIVTVTTVFFGASAEVIARDVTERIEDELSSVEAIEVIRSTSRDEVSSVEVELLLTRDLDAAAADVRDAVARVRAELPEGVEEPVIAKAAGDADPIMWLTLRSDARDRLELTDYADRHLVDPLSVVPGVARVIIGGARRYAMRIWLDREAMTRLGVAASDVTAALRRENLELPAGRLESDQRELTVRAETRLRREGEFRDLVLREDDGHFVRLGDVARVELGAESYRQVVRVDGEPAVGLGVVRQSKANTVAVSDGIRAEMERLREALPADVRIDLSFDSALFVRGSLREVGRTLGIALLLVVGVIVLFLRSPRAALVPVVTIPVALLATGLVLWAVGYSINTLTLLALVLAIGLVVDDAIVVLENVVRRGDAGEPRLVAAARGADEIGLAVVATTLVLVSVFVPLLFLTGDVGRLFGEFGVALASAVGFSSLAALTLGPMLCSRLVGPGPDDAAPAKAPGDEHAPREAGPERTLGPVARGYRRLLAGALRLRWLVVALGLLLSGGVYGLLRVLPRELAPVEDRGEIIVPLEAPEGATVDYTLEHVRAVEGVFAGYAGGEDPLVDRVISIVGLSQEGPGQVEEGLLIVRLVPWGERERGQEALAAELQPRLVTLPGARAFPVNPPSFGQEGFGAPLRFAVRGPTPGTTLAWAERLLARARGLPELVQPRLDTEATSPQLEVEVDRTRAADLDVSARAVGEALQTLFAEQEVTELVSRGETYEVIPQVEGRDRVTPADLEDASVRARSGDLVPLRQVVRWRRVGTPDALYRVDRLPAVTLEASLGPGVALGDALAAVEAAARAELPPAARFAYRGQSREYVQSTGGAWVALAMALLVAYLVLAAQFESLLHPLAILAPAPLAAAGGLLGLWLTGGSFNIFSQIALILLIGLMAKNSILVVEFANQLRDRGASIAEAVLSASAIRLRPVVMTSVATACGALPLVLSSGPGAEGRAAIGTVVLFGIAVATGLALLLVPALYSILAPFTGSPEATARRLAEQEEEVGVVGRE